MRRFNVKLFVSLIVALLVVAGCGLWIWKMKSGDTKFVILEKARAADKKDDFRVALEWYDAFLKRDASDADVRCEAAMVAAKLVREDDANTDDSMMARKLMDHALRANPKRDDIRRSLVEVLIRSTEFQDARDHIAVMERDGISDPNLEYQFALCSAQLDETAKAIERLNQLIGYSEQWHSFDKRVARAPEMIKAYALLVEIKLFRGQGGLEDEEFANAVMDQMVVANPELSDAYLARARYLRAERASTSSKQAERNEAAKADLRMALKLEPTNLKALLENAELYIAEKDLVAARANLDVALEHYSKERDVYIKLAQLARLSGEPRGTEKYLLAGLEELPDDPTLIWILMDAYLADENVEKARETLETIHTLNIPQDQVGLAKAKLYIIEAKWQDAIDELEKFLAYMTVRNPGIVSSTNVLLGQCYQNLQQPDRALAAFNQALISAPTSRQGQGGRASALMGLNRLRDALTVYRQLRAQIGAEDFDSNDQLYDEFTELLGKLANEDPEFQNELRNVRQGKVVQEHARAFDQAMAVVQSHLQNEHYNQALQYMEDMLVEHPGEFRLQQTYLRIRMAVNGPQDALNYLSRVLERPANPWITSADLLRFQMELITTVGGPDSPQQIKALEPEFAKYDREEQAELWHACSHYYIRQGQLADVRRCLYRAVELNPDDKVLALQVFDLALGKNDEQAMVAAIDNAQSRFAKESGLGSYMRGRYLVWKADNDPNAAPMTTEIEERIAEIENTRPRWYKLFELKGALCQRQERNDEAITLYREALNLGPPNEWMVRQLTNLLHRQSRFEEAREAMDHFRGESMLIKVKTINAIARTGDAKGTIAALHVIVPENATDPYDLIWRGDLLSHHEPGSNDAEKAYRRAVMLAPHLSHPRYKLVEFLARARRNDDAREEMRIAENELPYPASVRTLGRCYALFGNIRMAEHYLGKAVASEPVDPTIFERMLAMLYMTSNNAELAVHHLNAIVQRTAADKGPNDPVVKWARRSAARVIGRQPSHAAFRQALGLIEANREDAELKGKDLRLKAELLAARTDPIYRQSALELYATIPAGQFNKDERLGLARLYYRKGRWPECRELMEIIIAKNPQNVPVLYEYTSMLVRRKDMLMAQKWLRRLMAVAPDTAQIRHLAAEFAKEKGSKSEAVKIVEGFVPEKLNWQNSAKVWAAARIYEDLKYYLAAEEKFRQLAELNNVSYDLQLAGFLSRRGLVDESLEICEKSASKDTIREICRIGIGAISNFPDDLSEEQKQQVAGWFATARKEFPDFVVLSMQEAALLDAMGKAEQAVELLDGIADEKCSENERGRIANNRAYLKLKLGRLEAALADINQAIELLGPGAELLDTRAMVYLAMGNCELAIENLKEATLFDVDSGIFYFHLAVAHQCLNNRIDAEAAMNAAEEMGFNEDSVMASEQEAYAELKRWLPKKG